VCVPAVVVGAERGDVHRDLGRRVRAVDDRDEAKRAGSCDDLLHRQDEPGHGRDVADVDGSCPLARADEERVDDLARVA
jgi:hypothetical protein